MRNRMSWMLSALVGLAIVSNVQASPLTVKNCSFEETDASASPYYVVYNNSSTSPNKDAVLNWNPQGWWIATLLNSSSRTDDGPYSGVTGNQLLGISSWATSVDQVLADTYDANKNYTLTASLAISSTDHNNAEASVAMRLFYGTSEDPADMANRTIGQMVKTCGELSTSTLTDYSFVVTGSQVAAANAAGQAIGIEIAIPTATYGANFRVDNIRLDASPVPEPATLTLASTALIGLLAYARRKRARAQ